MKVLNELMYMVGNGMSGLDKSIADVKYDVSGAVWCWEGLKIRYVID